MIMGKVDFPVRQGRLLLDLRGSVRAVYAHYGWVVVGIAFLTVAAALGTRAAYGMLLVPLADTFGWGRGITAGAIALNALVAAVCSAPRGMLLDRWGGRRVFAGATALTGLGLATAALAREPWQLYAGVSILAGIGYASLRPQSMSVVVANWFVHRRGLAVGIVASGLGLGMLVLVPFTHWVIGQAGPQTALVALAALFLLGIAPLNALAQRNRPEEMGLQADGAGTLRRKRPGGGPRVRDAVRSGRFWALALGLTLSGVPSNFLLVHGVAHIVDAGFAPEVAAWVLGASGAAAAGAILLLGYLGDRWGTEKAYTLGSVALMGSLGLLYIAAPDAPALLYLYAGLFALGLASRQGLQGLLAAALLEGRALGALMGVVGIFIALGTALGPALGGWIFDYTGSYALAFVLAVASAVAAVGCVWVAAPRRGVLAGGDDAVLDGSGPR
jgi:MFS family permease